MSKPAKPAGKAWVESRPVNLRLDPEQFAKLQALAEAQSRPMANMIKFALQEWLDGRGLKGGK